MAIPFRIVRRVAVFSAGIFAAVYGGAAPWYESSADETPRTGDRQATAGSVTGVVTFAGDVPNSRLPDDTGRHRALLKVDRKSHGLQYAVVFLVTDSPTVARDSKPQAPLVIDQREHTFVPHVVALDSGRTVKFTNSDTANHNVRGSSLNAANEFNIFTGAGAEYCQTFIADRNRPVRLGCDIHPWMRAWVYAFDHPFYAVTDDQGEFEIGNVPPGVHRLFVRQADGGLSHQVSLTVRAGTSSHVEVEFTPADLKGR